MIRLPGRSHRGPLPPLTSEQIALRERLRHHVHVLAGDIGERNLERPGLLERVGTYIEEQFSSAGYTTGAHEYRVRGLPHRARAIRRSQRNVIPARITAPPASCSPGTKPCDLYPADT